MSNNLTADPMNSTIFTESSQAYCAHYDDSITAKVCKTLVYLLLFVTALVGNGFVGFIVYKTRQMRTTTNYLIVNMSASDAVFALVTMPLTVKFIYAGENLFSSGFLAEVNCKLVSFLQSSAVSISALSLTIIALDRFFAIMMPLKTVITKRLTRTIIAAIWMISFVLNSPVLYANTVSTDKKTGDVYCAEIWEPLLDTKKASKAYTVFLFVSLYLLPIVTMALLYTAVVYELWRGSKAIEHRNKVSYQQIHRANKKVLLMFVTVVILFAMFWLPVYIYQFNNYFGDDPCALPHAVIITGYTFAHATSAINPFIYCIFSENYRRGVLQILRNCCCAAKLLVGQRSSSTGATDEQRRAIELYAM